MFGEDRTTATASPTRREERDTRKRFGWYAYAEVQPWQRWLGGVRYDWTEFPVDPGASGPSSRT